MNEPEQMTAIARERGDKKIDTAIGELRLAAHDIGTRHGIPEDIAGHSIGELLGRIAYVPSMARDLRRVCGQELAKVELNKIFEDAPDSPSTARAEPKAKPIEPSKLPGNIPISRDVGQLDGITGQTVKALREAGLDKVGDIVTVPDEHLVKINGLGEKSVAQIRVAIAKASSQEGAQ